MRNLRTILFVVIMTGLVMACGFGGNPAAPGDGVATIVAATLGVIQPAPSTSTPAPDNNGVQGVKVTYKNVSFILPPGLASAAAPQTVPAILDDSAGPPWDIAPEHINFQMQNYIAPEGHFSAINLDIYPAQDFANLNTGANINLQRLQGVLNNPAAPLTNDSLPGVPYFNAASMFAAQAKRIHFQSGDGVRMVTQYGQAVGPIGNFGTFYHFQGLTADGKYYVVAVLPITAPFLQTSSDPNSPPPAGGVPFPGYNNSDQKYYDDYFKAIADKLDSTPADQFAPSLAALDALVESLTISP